jgi:hypothetical protein
MGFTRHLRRAMTPIVMAVVLVLPQICALAQSMDPSRTAAVQTSSVPQLIKLSGSSVDANGNPRSGTLAVEFAIYSDQTGGMALWEETQNVGFTGGRYTVLLGSTQAGGIPTQIFSSGEARWMGVRLLADGEPEQARTLLVSVPYALKSGDADTLGGRPASAYVLAAPTVGAVGPVGGDSQTGTATSSTGVSTGTGTTPKLAAAPLTGNSTVVTPGGTATFLSKFSDTATIVDSAIAEVGGNVGIGVATPGSPLDVELNSNQNTDTSTLVSTFVNTVSPTVDQVNGTQQGFISDMEIRTNHLINSAFSNYSFIADFGAGTRGQLTGMLGEVYNDGTASATSIVGLSGYVESSGAVHDLASVRTGSPNGNPGGPPVGTQTFGGGTTTNQYGLWVLGNVNGASTVTNNYGIKVENQNGVGANNWALATGNGLVQFGDRVLFAPAANSSSMNIPSGSTPIALAAGDFWNSGSLLRFYTGSATKTLAFTDGNITGNSAGFTGSLGGDVSGGQSATTVQKIQNVNVAAGVPANGQALIYDQPSGSWKPQTLPVPNPELAIRGITYIAGCDSCSVLQNTDSERAIYMNVIGAMSIAQVTCISDAGAPVINLQRDDGTPANILAADLACSSSGASTTSFASGEAVLNLNEKINFVMVNAGTTAKRVTVVIKALVN